MRAEPSGEPEPPIRSVLKSTLSGGGPVTAGVHRKRPQLSDDGRHGGHRHMHAVQMALRHRAAVVWQKD